ncbi:hypothetical protein DV532_22410 [Pseudomonas sp. Leaf58]|nr:hypothetical protein DV532_22410 [Pseudomonas sp. Leaf58]
MGSRLIRQRSTSSSLPTARPSTSANCRSPLDRAIEGPVGAGSPANAMVNPPTHSRVNPLLQGSPSAFDYLTTTLPFIIEMWPGKVQKKL